VFGQHPSATRTTSAAIQFLGRPIPFLILLICSACQVWREAVSGVKLEQAAPRGRSTAQNVWRFDGSPKVVDATLRDIDDYAHVVQTARQPADRMGAE
jgi:hypothetical protein